MYLCRCYTETFLLVNVYHQWFYMGYILQLYLLHIWISIDLMAVALIFHDDLDALPQPHPLWKIPANFSCRSFSVELPLFVASMRFTIKYSGCPNILQVHLETCEPSLDQSDFSKYKDRSQLKYVISDNVSDRPQIRQS